MVGLQGEAASSWPMKEDCVSLNQGDSETQRERVHTT